MVTGKSALVGQADAIPPLREGERLTAEEFERRYEAMPELKKAELIEGMVYVGSPVRHVQHGQPHFQIGGWAAAYVSTSPGVVAPLNAGCGRDVDRCPSTDLGVRLARLDMPDGRAHVDRPLAH